MYTRGRFLFFNIFWDITMHPMLNIAIRTARKAGDFVAKSFEQTDKIETTKKAITSLLRTSKTMLNICLLI